MKTITIEEIKEYRDACDHDWQVFSTCVGEHVVIMCKCDNCLGLGLVENFTADEWSDAFHAPSNPYPWLDNSRVIVTVEQADGTWKMPA